MKKIILIPLMIVAAIAVIINCDLPDTELHIASGSFMTHVTEVNFVNDTSNEAAGKLIEGLDGTVVEITGPDAAKVYNIEGKRDFKIQGGALLLLLDPNIKFVSDDEKYTVNLIVEPKGYLKRNVPVTFTKNENNGFVEIALVEIAAISKMEKIARAEDNTGTIDATAGLNKEIVIKADNSKKAVEGVTTEIVVPQGVKMKNEKGQILTGTLKAEVISFTETGEGTSFFPGGMFPENIDMGGGRTEEGAFVSAGFTAVNMTVGGERVSTFDGKPVTIKMNLGANTHNPKENRPYQVGDDIDIWSYETENGQWKFEKTGKIVLDGTKLCVMFETTHLSYFNLDYLASGDGGRCRRSNLKIKWPGVDMANKVKCRFNFRYVGSTSSSDRWRQSAITKNDYIYDGVVIDLKNAPQLAVEVEVYDLENNTPLGKFNFKNGDICGGNGNVNIDVAAPVKKQTISIEFKGLCTGTRVYPPVGTRVFYKKASEPNTAYKQFHYVDYLSRLSDKIITTELLVGTEYTFKVFAGAEGKEKTITLQSTKSEIVVEIPQEICTALIK